MNNMDDYQRWTRETAIYPSAKVREDESDSRGQPQIDAAMNYVILKLLSEVGEMAGKLGKYYRDATDPTKLREALIYELGDVLWYVARCADECSVPLSHVASYNVLKLEDRKERGVLQGSGDNR